MSKKLVVTSEELLIKIPMKPHLVKFLTKLFGDRCRATKTSWFGLDIVNILTKDYQKPQKIFANDSYYLCIVPKTLCITYGHFFFYNELPSIEVKVNRIFNQFMRSHIDLSIKKGEDAMDSLRIFLDYYEISEDDYKLESAYRNYTRHKEKSVA
jgi:hypothetical protein